MKRMVINTAMDVSREASALPDVKVIYTSASGMMGPQFNDDKVELDISQASGESKSFIREIASIGWEIEERDMYWTLYSDYYPLTPEEMTQVRDPTEESDA